MTDSRFSFADPQYSFLKGSPEARVPNSVNDEILAPLLPGISSISWDSASQIVHCTREELFEELLRLRDDERERVGHELHDSAGQLLLYLQLSVARLRSHESADDHGELIEEIQATTRQIASEIRSLAFMNHPMSLSADGLASALQALVEGFGKRTGYRVRFEAQGDVSRIDPAASLALLRVAQEALVNIHRHARASSATMQLTSNSEGLQLMVRDDGIGMPDHLAAHAGVGVEGMRFRVEQLGGEFQVSNAHPGTQLVARLPVATFANAVND